MGDFLVSSILCLLCGIGLSLTFYSVCIVCEDFLVPAIEVFIDQFKIPEDVAGVTLIAFGSAAPELFLNILAGAEGTSDLSLSALLGSSIIAFGLIPPLCIVCTTEKEIELKAWPIIRETGFYLVGLIIFLIISEDGELTVKEAGITCAIYGIYVLAVVIQMFFYPEDKSKMIDRDDIEMSKSDTASLISTNNDSGSGKAVSRNLDRINGGAHTRNSVLQNSSQDKEDFEKTAEQDAEKEREREREVSRAPAIRKDSMTKDYDQDNNNILSSLAETVGLLSVDTEKDKSGAGGGDKEKSGGFLNNSVKILTDAISSVKSTVSPSPGGGSRDNANGNSNGNGNGGISIFDWEGEDVESVVKVPKGLNQNIVYYCKNCAITTWAKVRPQVMAVRNTATAPIDFVIRSLIPSLHAPGTDKNVPVPFNRAIGCLTVSICLIAVEAWFIITISEVLIKAIGAGTSTIGATLVALGSEIPDTISSIALARSGYNDGAMAGAIGSQVINITLGVGLPTLLSCWLTGESIKINHKETRSLWLLTLCLFIVMMGYVATTLPVARTLSCKIQKYTYMKRPGAWALLTLLGFVTVAFIYLNEEVMDEIQDDETNTGGQNQDQAGVVSGKRFLMGGLSAFYYR